MGSPADLLRSGALPAPRAQRPGAFKPSPATKVGAAPRLASGLPASATWHRTPRSLSTRASPSNPFVHTTGRVGPTKSGAARTVAAPPSSEPAPALPLPPPGHNLLHDLIELGGQSPWIDNLTRDWVASGHLSELVQRGVRGLTSNPTIFEKAIGSSAVYDDQITEIVGRLGLRAADVEEPGVVEAVYWEIAKTDIAHAAGVMRQLYDQSQGSDGFVSLEVSPALAHDSAGTEEAARALHSALALPNLMVKIPATKDGLPAIRAMVAEGRNVNVTLIFSLTRYADVIEAYISGLEARASADPSADLRTTSSVASFFISRVDSAVDARLAAIGSDEANALKGKAAISQAVLAYQLFRNKFSGPRMQRLAGRGAREQRPLWASTGVKDKGYKDTLYVDELIGPNTVNTMPDSTLLSFAHHGKVSRTIDVNVDEACAVLQKVEALGISMEGIAQELEADGVKKFADSFGSLLETLKRKILLYTS